MSSASVVARPVPPRFAPGVHGEEQRRYAAMVERLAALDRARVRTPEVAAFEARRDVMPKGYNPFVGERPSALRIETRAERLGRRHAGEKRERVSAFLAHLGLEEESGELEAIEERLENGREPALKHAATSARALMKGLADYLYPAREQPWVDRWGEEHGVRADRVGNRIQAYVDERLRRELTPRQQRGLAAEVDAVTEWTGRGVHEAAPVAQCEETYGRLLHILSLVVRAYAAS